MRVMTWNLWWRFGPWARRRQAILTALHAWQPDAVGLQEVWARGEENLAGWLADRLGMHWTWAASHTGALAEPPRRPDGRDRQCRSQSLAHP